MDRWAILDSKDNRGHQEIKDLQDNRETQEALDRLVLQVVVDRWGLQDSVAIQVHQVLRVNQDRPVRQAMLDRLVLLDLQDRVGILVSQDQQEILDLLVLPVRWDHRDQRDNPVTLEAVEIQVRQGMRAHREIRALPAYLETLEFLGLLAHLVLLVHLDSKAQREPLDPLV